MSMSMAALFKRKEAAELAYRKWVVETFSSLDAVLAYVRTVSGPEGRRAVDTWVTQHQGAGSGGFGGLS